MNKDKVNEVLNIEEDKQEPIVITPEVVDEDGNTEDEAQRKISYGNDFDFIRKTLRDCVSKGAIAIDQIAEVAESSDSPRAFEVMGALLRITSENSESLMDLHSKRQEFENPQNQKKLGIGDTNITNNTVMVGTSTELQELLDKAKQDVEKIEETSKQVCSQVIMNKKRGEDE